MSSAKTEQLTGEKTQEEQMKRSQHHTATFQRLF